MERENDEAYGRFMVVEQELRNRVEQGREAEYASIFRLRVFILTFHKTNVDAGIPNTRRTVSKIPVRITMP